MTKAKYILLFVMVAMLILVFPSISNATDDATEPVVEYTRTITGNDGSITINLTGLTLDESKAYSFALTTRGGTPETWHTLTEYTTNTAQVNLSSATSDIVAVLKVTDTGVLYIKDNSDDSYVVNGLQINLKLPLLQAIPYRIGGNSWNHIEILPGLYGSIGDTRNYNSGNTYYKVEKVTDREFVEAFLENNKDTSTLEELLPIVPDTGYSTDHDVAEDEVEDGLYIVWVRLTGEGCKNVNGAIIYDGLPDATTVGEYIEGLDLEKPTVQSIAVTSPQSGTYKTGQTVKITVTFSENITGETVPTLKIKFGTSEERTVTNGTISGKTIVYSYNIVDGDKGQLAVTGYAGGAIKDAAGNDAVISSKVISGNTIKANVEGTTTNNTQNQDKETNDGTTGDKGTGTTENKNENKKEETKNDGTQATGKIPHAGVEIGIVFIMLVVVIAGVVVYTRYNKMKDIL